MNVQLSSAQHSTSEGQSGDSRTYAGNESGLNVLLYAILICLIESKENQRHEVVFRDEVLQRGHGVNPFQEPPRLDCGEVSLTGACAKFLPLRTRRQCKRVSLKLYCVRRKGLRSNQLALVKVRANMDYYLVEFEVLR